MTPLSKLLIIWFESQKRDLPWRKNINPYRVWVSEVMLQQTQVFTVIPYFERWMKAFPTVQKLAEAPIESVIKMWEGLGYYSRARNLHQGAKQVVHEYSAQLPQTEKELLSISGIGPYTASAILSFAFHMRCSLIDGNVKRVMARLYELKTDFSKSSDYTELENHLEKLVPHEKHWIFNEAMMELGATVCKPKNPLCQKCPIQSCCQSFKAQTQNDYPMSKKRKTIQKLYRVVWVFQHEGQWLIQKQHSDIMKDLYQFVSEDVSASFSFEPAKFDWHALAKDIIPLVKVKHSYTYFNVQLLPYLIFLEKPIHVKDYEWMSIEAVMKKPFSAGHRKIVKQLAHHHSFSKL